MPNSSSLTSRGGQVLQVDLLLVRLDPGHEGVRVHGHPIGSQLDRALDRVAEREGRLLRQPVDEVEVDRLGPAGAQELVQVAGLLEGLVAVDGVLHPGVEVLDPHRHAVEAELPQERHLRRARHAWVDLDRHLRARFHDEAGADRLPEARHLVDAEVGRGAAAPVQLGHAVAAAEARCDEVDLAFEMVEVAGRHPALAGDDHVAAAEAAALGAEGQVDVERQRRIGVQRGGVQLLEVALRREAVVELDGRRVRGVARAGAVEAGESLRRDGREGRGHAGPPKGARRRCRAHGRMVPGRSATAVADRPGGAARRRRGHLPTTPPVADAEMTPSWRHRPSSPRTAPILASPPATRGSATCRTGSAASRGAAVAGGSATTTWPASGSSTRRSASGSRRWSSRPPGRTCGSAATPVGTCRPPGATKRVASSTSTTPAGERCATA
jgi:hypothetical protein